MIAGDGMLTGDESDMDDNMLSVQLTVSACWLSLKEASLGVGALARHLPLLGEAISARPQRH